MKFGQTTRTIDRPPASNSISCRARLDMKSRQIIIFSLAMLSLALAVQGARMVPRADQDLQLSMPKRTIHFDPSLDLQGEHRLLSFHGPGGRTFGNHVKHPHKLFEYKFITSQETRPFIGVFKP